MRGGKNVWQGSVCLQTAFGKVGDLIFLDS